MSSYTASIIFSISSFPVLALLCTVPYMVYQYRRYGSIPFWKSFAVFTFIFYITTAYYMVVLPLPDDHSAVVAYAATPQLVPFNFAEKIAAEVDFRLFDPSTWLPTLACADVYEAFFNLLLTVPLGLFLRYFFNRKWWQVLIIGFLTTLFFEVSQLTGLFGIYAHPYRLFDVDDLMVNTLGAMVGYWIAGPISKHLPDIATLNEEAVEESANYTTFTRRLLAFVLDLVPVVACCALAMLALPASNRDLFALLTVLMVSTGIFFMLVPTLTRGATIGDALLKLRIVRPDGSPATRWQPAARYFLLFWVFLITPLWCYALLPTTTVDGSPVSREAVGSAIVGMYIIWLVTIVVRAIRSAGRHPFVMLNGMISHTRIMSVEQARHLREQADQTEKEA